MFHSDVFQHSVGTSVCWYKYSEDHQYATVMFLPHVQYLSERMYMLLKNAKKFNC